MMSYGHGRKYCATQKHFKHKGTALISFSLKVSQVHIGKNNSTFILKTESNFFRKNLTPSYSKIRKWLEHNNDMINTSLFSKLPTK
jgi:hypothetical protein